MTTKSGKLIKMKKAIPYLKDYIDLYSTIDSDIKATKEELINITKEAQKHLDSITFRTDYLFFFKRKFSPVVDYCNSRLLISSETKERGLLRSKQRKDILNNHLSVFSKSYEANLDYLNGLFNIEKKVALAKTAVSILECPFTDEDNLNEIHNLSSLCEIVAEMQHHKDKEYS